MTTYRSKVDAWLLVVLAFSIVVSLAGAVMVASTGSPAAWGIAVLTAGLGAGLPIWLLLTTHYALDHTHLLVQSGPFRWRIAVAEITAVTPTSNPLSSPALSLDRLRIAYGRGRWMMISPADKEGFLRALAELREG